MKTKEIIGNFTGKAGKFLINIADEIGGILGNIVVAVIVIVAYCIVGFVLALPYSYLAGGGEGSLELSILLLPIAAIIALFFYKIDGVIGTNRIGFWIFIGYLLLPVFANWISVLLKRVEFGEIGNFIFEHRYSSLMEVPIIAAIGIIVWGYFDVMFGKHDTGQSSEVSDSSEE